MLALWVHFRLKTTVIESLSIPVIRNCPKRTANEAFVKIEFLPIFNDRKHSITGERLCEKVRDLVSIRQSSKEFTSD